MRYILVNWNVTDPNGQRWWNQNNPDSIKEEHFEEVQERLPRLDRSQIRTGIGFILSYLNSEDKQRIGESLRRFLCLAQKTNTPVLIQLDGESWWEGRPDLWNWWDCSKGGYNPENRENVEWTGWSSDKAIKIAWRNWGSQQRVKPAPNLMSPRYREACREMLVLLVPIVVGWWKALPASKEDLFVGISVGHESSIGVNAWYYPNGNDLLNQPCSEDPTKGFVKEDVPSRGVVQIGYAAVKTAGIRSEGQITEADLAEVIRRHLKCLSRQVKQHGVPREKLFTHCGGWADGELLYRAALNEFSCPGWSFYRHAGDPRGDIGVQDTLRKTKAPYWAAVEWSYRDSCRIESWHCALENTLFHTVSDTQCRFVCIYNWEDIRKSKDILKAIGQVVAASASTRQ